MKSFTEKIKSKQLIFNKYLELSCNIKQKLSIFIHEFFFIHLILRTVTYYYKNSVQFSLQLSGVCSMLHTCTLHV